MRDRKRVFVGLVGVALLGLMLFFNWYQAHVYGTCVDGSGLGWDTTFDQCVERSNVFVWIGRGTFVAAILVLVYAIWVMRSGRNRPAPLPLQ